MFDASSFAPLRNQTRVCPRHVGLTVLVHGRDVGLALVGSKHLPRLDELALATLQLESLTIGGAILPSGFVDRRKLLVDRRQRGPRGLQQSDLRVGEAIVPANKIDGDVAARQRSARVGECGKATAEGRCLAA